jgi:hypothetical protein
LRCKRGAQPQRRPITAAARQRRPE